MLNKTEYTECQDANRVLVLCKKKYLNDRVRVCENVFGIDYALKDRK